MSKIINTLGELRRGKFLEDLDAELRHVVDAVRAAAEESGGVAKGELSVKLSIKSDANDALQIDVVDAITAKFPGRQGGRTAFYASADGALVRQDPRQYDMPLRDVSRAPQPTAG